MAPTPRSGVSAERRTLCPREVSWRRSAETPLRRKAGAALLLFTLLVLGTFTARAQDEASLIGILQSNAGAVEKCEACKQLRLVGTALSVPELAALLNEERVAQAARYALEGMPAPEAVAALREALRKTSGLLKAGVVDSLGWRRDTAAVPLLGPLLADPDATLASAAASALGKIGGPDSLAALEAAKAKAPPAVRPVVLEGLLACAEQRLAAGQPSEATAIYQALFVPTEAEFIRVAAYAGLIRAAGDKGFALINSALAGTDSAAQTAALELADNFPQLTATGTFATLLPQSPPAQQIALLALLQQRGAGATLPAVLAAARGTNPVVRVAALKALGELGDASAVPLLAEAATSRDPAEQSAARQAVVALHRGDVGSALVKELNTAPPAVQAELARALTTRAEKGAVPALLQMARSDRPASRQAALLALGSLADGSHLSGLVSLLAEAKTPAARGEAIGVFAALAERAGDGQPLDVDPLVRGLASGDADTRQALLQVSALFVDERLRTAFRAALKDPGTRSAAARALCGTRDAALLPDLLEVARQASDPGLRALAIEGSVRLATDENVTLSPAQRTDALAAAAGLATRAEDKRLVLSGLARVPHATTLKLAEQLGADSAVQAEAELACLQIAQKLGPADFAAVEATLTRLAASAANPAVRKDARSLLQKLNTGWLCAGPYRQAGKQAQDLFDVAFAPEQGDAAAVTWQRAPGAAEPARAGEVDLSSIVGGDHCVVYLKTRVYVPDAQPVLFLIGTDDGIKLWVNGELVHANNEVRGLTPDQDRAKGKLRAGWNDFRAKITQHTVGCGMVLRIKREDGGEVTGLRVEPQGGKP